MTTSLATNMWSRSDLRARWKSLIVLGVLAGLIMGVAAAAFDGARRTATSLKRLSDKTNASDAVVFGSQVGVFRPDWSKLAKRRGVVAIAPWTLLFGKVNGQSSGPLFGAVDDQWLNQVDRPIVVRGRMFDPNASDEVVVDEDGARQTPLGSTITFTALSNTDVDFLNATGPTVELRIVGVIRNLQKFVFTNGYVNVSPGYVKRYGDRVLILENANVKLTPDADIREFRAMASKDVAEGIPVLDMRAASRRVRTTLNVEQAMLIVLAGVLLVAGVILVGQALLRSAATIGTDSPTLRAMGLTRADVVRAATLPHLLTVAIGLIISALTTVAASRWFPVGYAAKIDPDRGIRVAPMLLIVSLALLLLAVAAATLWSAWRVSGSTAAPTLTRPGPLRTWVRHRRPITVGLGLAMATEWRSGARRTGAAAALVGAAAAVSGVVGMINLNHGIDDALSHEERAGVVWDASVLANTENKTDRGVSPKLFDDIARIPDVTAAISVVRAVTELSAGTDRSAGIAAFTVMDHPSKPGIRFTVVDGRLPTGLGEIALGPASAELLGVGLGDEVRLADGTDCVVVGVTLFPNDIHSAFDEGALLANEQFFTLQKNLDLPGVSNDKIVAVRFRPGDYDKQMQVLTEAVGNRAEAIDVKDIPRELLNLRNVRMLPFVLAVFLAVLGMSAIGHSLFTSVRHRRRDFAVYRAMGITRRGATAIVLSQATTVAATGLAIGIPLGIIAGRFGWQQITDRVPLRFVAPVAFVAFAVVVPLALLIANALAVIPSRRASRLRPAVVLRSE